MDTKFIHLNLHTEYSISDGIVRIGELFSKCLKESMPAVALTDQSNLFALVKFYKKATSNGVKPIIGVDVWLDNEKNRSKPFKLLLLAQNQTGYNNIVKIISESYVRGQHLGIPIVKREWLKELSAGLIVLSGAKEGDVGRALLSNDLDKAKKLLNFWQENFSDRYYLELQRTGRREENEYLERAFDLALESKTPLVATNAVRFLSSEDFEAHEARVCINRGAILNDENRERLYTDQHYFRSQDEMVKLFQDIPESLANSVEIAKRCNVEMTFGEIRLPIFTVPGKEIDIEEYFLEEAYSGLERRLQDGFSASENFDEIKKEYTARLEYEISVLKQMGFTSYFLIVADFIGWSKRNGIPVGPGRGSGAGSLVAYVLGITNVDPLEHGLLFERFLNPERVSMPDFDIDFCMDGRDRVISYVVERYGKEKVAQIITYGTMAAKAVVRDVGRVLGNSYGFVDKIAKLIPFTLGITLQDALTEEELLQQRYKEDDEVRTLIDLAKKLEGITRNAGKHAGGVVIAPSALTDFTPLYCEEDGESVVTQLDKDDIETIGLVKFDFLGLRTLTIIDWAVKAVNARRKSRGEKPVDIDRITVDDENVYNLLKAGKTAAIFQLESRMSRDLIQRFKPNCFDDLTAMGAIIRPGVLQSGMLGDIIDRKHGLAPITYLHPKLEPILKPTYGVAIYQEQVMQMAQSLAGYSLGGADLLRRAMGKKKPEEMARQREIFKEGAAKNSNIDENLANRIFDYMEKFASYGFNKSHSAAYGLISYQTAWLKTHYPAEFMAAVLSSDMDDTDKVVLFLNECKHLDLDIEYPNINKSDYKFIAIGENKILYGLGAIKGVGQAAIESMLEERKTNGPFISLFDLCKRVDKRKVNKRVLEALIYAGALDEIGPNRSSQIASIELALKAADQHASNINSGQGDLFGGLLDDKEDLLPDFVKTPDCSKEERLRHEKSVLGFYLDGHPIECFLPELKQFVNKTIAELRPEIGKTILIAGFVSASRVLNTKSGKRLAIVTLEDMSGTIDVTMFDEVFTSSRDFLVADQLVIVEGEVAEDSFSNSYRIRATKAMSFDQARMIYARGLVLSIKNSEISESFLNKLNNILKDYRGGKCPIFIDYANDETGAKLVLGDEWRIVASEDLLVKLKESLGEDKVSFAY